MNEIANRLSENNLFLQHPEAVRPGCAYDNPQFLGKVNQSMVGSTKYWRNAKEIWMVTKYVGTEAERGQLEAKLSKERNSQGDGIHELGIEELHIDALKAKGDQKLW